MQHNDQMAILAKRTMNDSVFTNMFGNSKYTLQLYKALHPEDTEVSEADINIVTLANVLANQPYNDLGFIVRNRLLILVEAQSTWTVNILIRCLMYLAESIRQYLHDTKQNVYGPKKVMFPIPEVYVIYTGEREDKPEYLSLSKDFFEDAVDMIDLKIKMIYDSKQGDIINQYIRFTWIYREQMKIYGRTLEAIQETIRICLDQDILKDYLKEHEKEVLTMLSLLFNQEEVLEMYVESERREAAEKAAEKATEETEKRMAYNLKEQGFSETIIATALKKPIDVIRAWLAVPVTT